MKKKVLSLLLVIVMVLGMFPMSAMAANSSVQWAGSMNFNESNNQVTSTSSVTAANRTELKWQYPLNNTVIHGGAYYAGTQVIVGDHLYATGGNKLHKIALTAGVCDAAISVPETAKLNEVQYLCYGGGYLYFVIRESITAYRLNDLSQVWTVNGDFGQYHPVQYFEYDEVGYLWCNGNLLKAADGSAVTIRQKDSDEPLDITGFAWSSGARASKYFYVTDKCYVYAIDMSTWKVADQVAYYEGTVGSSYNTSGQVAYDAASGRLFWGCKNYSTKNLYSIKVGEDGLFAADSLRTVDAGFTSVNLPVIYNGRVYLVGQGKPCIAVFSIDAQTDEITRLYTAGDSSLTVQTNPILSTADGVPRLYFFGFDGKLYVMEDNGGSGTLVELAQSPNPSGVKYPNSYEQFAMDSNGNIYCYNESGYLFCYGMSLCELPTITTDLSADLRKIQSGSSDAKLGVTAEVGDGGTLSYQWQSSSDGKAWADIDGATAAEYTLPTAETGTVFYRCVITNTKDGDSAKTISSAAEIQVKQLSTNVSLNMAANTANKLDGVVAGTETIVDDDKIIYVENFSGTMKYLALGAVDEGTFEPIKDNFTLYQGLDAGTTLSSPGNISNSELYTRRYYRSAGFALPLVASAAVTAEDGVSEGNVYIVVDNDGFSKYTVKVTGLTSADANYYSAENGISFTAADQSVTLSPVTETIGSGEEDQSNWKWSSSDTTVATVDENGTVKCIGGGEANIAFTCGQLTASCKVTSSAAAHTTHTYTDGICSVCGTQEPAAVPVTFTLVKDGDFVIAKDGVTELYKAAVTVSDADCDGSMTLNDVFLAAHKAYSANGEEDFATEASSYGPFITKLWGVESSSVGYYQNGTSASGLTVEVKKNDDLTAYFYQDTTNYSDVYTAISGQTTVSAGNAVTYTASGIAGGVSVVPKGAAVAVYKIENDTEVLSATTTVSEDGTFALTFAEAGSYIVKLGGTASYTGSVWDRILGNYAPKEFDTAPVIPSRLEVTVLPAASKTVYVSISCKNGSFAVNKNGEEMCRFPVTAMDDPASPDGRVSIKEVLVAAHEQYHADGISALAGHTNNFITKLWGESNSGNCSYYFNDLYMSGSGTKTGSNGREFRDQLLDTTVENEDHFYIYSFQTSNWSKGDLYAYFYPVSETATADVAKTLTVKSAGGYGSNTNKLETSLVKVTDSSGVEQTALTTTVGADGSFSITFPEAGTYTVDVRTNGTNFVTPARCTVTVSAGGSGGVVSDRISATISVVNPNGGYFLRNQEYTMKQGDTAADLLKKTSLQIVSSDHSDYGFYVESINGIGEFDQGSGSGWMYKVNGEFPDYSADLYELTDGDIVEWVYTRDLGEDVGGGSSSSGTKIPEADRTAAREAKNLIANIGTVTEASGNAIKAARSAYDALTDDQKELVPNYDDLLEAEKKYAELVGTAFTFTDVSEDDYYYVAVKWAAEKGITSGTSETTFSPHASCTRAQMVTFLWRAAGSPEPSANETAFGDVDLTSYYYKALLWAVENGITSGTSATTFSPDAVCTRGQMATFLYRSAKTPAVSDSTSFADVGKSAYYKDAVLWAKAEGITAGTSATTFSPDAACTRAQMVTFLYRYLAK